MTILGFQTQTWHWVLLGVCLCLLPISVVIISKITRRTGGRLNSGMSSNRLVTIGAFALLFFLGGTVAELVHGALGTIPHVGRWVPAADLLQAFIMVVAALGIGVGVWQMLVPVTARETLWRVSVYGLVAIMLGLLLASLNADWVVEREQATICPEVAPVKLNTGRLSTQVQACVGQGFEIIATGGLDFTEISVNAIYGITPDGTRVDLRANPMDVRYQADSCMVKHGRGRVEPVSNCTVQSVQWSPAYHKVYPTEAAKAHGYRGFVFDIVASM